MLYFKRYPSGGDYANVAMAIIQKYPFMKSSIDKSPAVSTHKI